MADGGGRDVSGTVRQPMRFLAELDGLRAVAVGAVVLFHYGVGHVFAFAGTRVVVAFDGSAGVTVFFALSGYLITRLLLEELDRRGRVAPGAFWQRRVRRIVPLATAGVLVAVALTLWRGLRWERRQPLAALFGMANWERYASNVAYGQSGYAPLTHYWSLAIEEQFYLVLVPVFLVVIALTRRRGVPAARVVLSAVMAVVAVCSVLATWRWRHDPQDYYHSFARVGELLAGSLLAVIATSAPRRWRGAVTRAVRRPIAAHLLLGGLVVTLAVAGAHVPQSVRIVTSALTVAVIVAQPRLLAWRPLVWVGKVSFGVYVWHPLVRVALAGTMTDRHGRWVSVLISVALTLVVSAASFRLFEHPLRRRASWPVARATAIAMVVVTTVVTWFAPFAHNTTFVVASQDGAYLPVVASRDRFVAAGQRDARISTYGDSSMVAWSPLWKAWAGVTDGVTFVEAPALVDGWTNDQLGGGLERVGCSLLWDHPYRWYPGGPVIENVRLDLPDRPLPPTGASQRSCDYSNWVTPSLPTMNLDVLIVDLGPTVMLEMQFGDEWSRPGEATFDQALSRRMDEFEQLAAEHGATVLWVAMPDVSATDELVQMAGGGYLAWNDPHVIDGLAAIAGSRTCHADLRDMTRTGGHVDPAKQHDIYVDWTHFNGDGGAVAVAEVRDALKRCVEEKFSESAS